MGEKEREGGRETKQQSAIRPHHLKAGVERKKETWKNESLGVRG